MGLITQILLAKIKFLLWGGLGGGFYMAVLNSANRCACMLAVGTWFQIQFQHHNERPSIDPRTLFKPNCVIFCKAHNNPEYRVIFYHIFIVKARTGVTQWSKDSILLKISKSVNVIEQRLLKNACICSKCFNLRVILGLTVRHLDVKL